jgi:folate-binding protein YgfZ
MSEMTNLQALRESAVVLDGAGHDVLRATGNDRQNFLQRITSGTVAGKTAGQGSRTLLLDVRGRVLASLLAFIRARSVRLLVAAGKGSELAAGLGKYAIMDDFQVVVEDELTTLALLGPRSVEVLGAVGVADIPPLLDAALYDHAEVTSSFGPLWLAHGRACGTDGLCVVATREARDALVQALVAKGVARLEPALAEALRIAALDPKVGAEITPDRFPVEIGLGAAIDHGKGCYVGQETIVRMRDRGIVRKRLVFLRVTGESVPAAGDKIAGPSTPTAGQITSVGQAPGEAPVALAVLTSAVTVGATVQIEHEGASLAAEVAGESLPWGPA